ncbi:MAG: hypothetical protein ACLQGV_21800 [Bryobacteraceae bacterium]
MPFGWVHTYCSYLTDKRDQFYDPLRPSLWKYLLALPVGTCYNARHAMRFWKEWAAVMNVAGGARRWRASRAGRILRLRAK